MGARTPRRPRARGLSVRSRILASILVVAFLGMAGAGATAYLAQRGRILEGVDELLLSHVESARGVVTGVASGDALGDVQVAAPDAAGFASTRDALNAVLGRVIPGRTESSLGILGGRAAIVPSVVIDFHLENDDSLVRRIVGEVDDGAVHRGTAVSDSRAVRYIAVPVTVSGDAEAGVYVAAVDLDAQLSDLTAAFTTYTAVAGAALLAIALVGWFVVGRLLRPIRDLRLAASRITASDRTERIAVLGHDDVSDLTGTVNDMLDRLDDAMTGQRRLLDDVRHELKTPITIVRGHLELLDPGDVDDVVATRALAIDELDRMAGLVDDIEALAESQAIAPRRVPTDLAAFTAEVFAKASVLPDHEWALAGSARGVASIDPARMTQAWLQLVDNAAKYSPPGSLVELGSTELTEGFEFWVRDRGSGVPDAARQRIFERFGRVDAGRGIRGSGLGLPIVAAIATAHGGRVALSSSPHGSRFAIVIPRETDGTAGAVATGSAAGEP
jgi:two-component system OmpR family sensor kinase